MSEKVSVVLPIYNVEKYLDKAVESVTRQTYQNLEIILVDDGSTDSSGKKCDTWKKQDERIHVLHKENGGLSSARNAGMDVATGRYIMFTDSDDWLEKDIVEKCVDRIQNDRSDVVIFGYQKEGETGKPQGIFTFGNDTFNQEEMTAQLFHRILEMSFGYAWNKLYDLRVIRESGVRSDGEVIDREDLIFHLQMMPHWKKVSYLNMVGYHYLQRGNSLLHNANLARLEHVDTFCERLHEIKLSDEVMHRKVYNMCVLHYLADGIIKNILWNDVLAKKEKLAFMKETIGKCLWLEELYEDKENPKHLNVLYRSIKTGDMRWFYRYVWMADWKRKVLGK